MSAVPKHPRAPALGGLRMTADEFLALGETLERYELIDGVVCPMAPSPLAGHNEIALEIAYQAKAFARPAGAARVFA